MSDLPWRIVVRQRRFRPCPRCGRQWPEGYETCPACAVWLGRSLQAVEESWAVPRLDRAAHPWPAGEDLWTALPAGFAGPLVECVSVLCGALVLPPAAGVAGDGSLRRWCEELPALLRARGSYLVEPAPGSVGLAAVFAGGDDDRDHAQRAVQAAREAAELAAAVRLAAGPSGGVRLFFGVNTGPASLWRHKGGFRFGGAAMARAEGLATCLGPDRIVLSRSTYLLAREAYEAVGAPPLDRDDPALPPLVYVLRGPKPAVTWRGLLADHPVPLVGRQREMEALAGCWERSQHGSGQVVHLVAEAGGGKSKLLDALAQRVAAGGEAAVWRAWGACYGCVDGQLLSDLLAPEWRPTGLPRAEARETLLRRLRDAGADPEVTFPLLAWLFGLDGGMATTTGAAAQALDALVAATASRRPLALLLDDLHWADAFSLEALWAALPRWSDRSVLTVLAYRPSLQDRMSVGRVGGVRVELPPLAPEAAEALLASHEPDVLPRWHRAILDAAAGSPLYVEECVGLLHDMGVLPGGAGFPDVPLPRSLPELLLRRIQVWADQQLTGLELQAGLSSVGGQDLVAALDAVERRIDDWLDRIEAGGYVSRLELGMLLRPLRAVEHRLLLLRWRLGAAAPRHSRLREAVERLYAGTGAEWRRALRDYADDSGDRAGAFHQAVEAAEAAGLRRDAVAATDFYRLALELRAETGGGPLEPSAARLHQELASALATRGRLQEAEEAFAAALAAESGTGHRMALAARAALTGSWSGRPEPVAAALVAAEAAWAAVGESRDGQSESPARRREALEAGAYLALARVALAAARADPAAAAQAAAAVGAALAARLPDAAFEAALLGLAAAGQNGGWHDALQAVLARRPEGGADAEDVRLLLVLAGWLGPGEAAMPVRALYARRALALAQRLGLDGWAEAAARRLAGTGDPEADSARSTRISGSDAGGAGRTPSRR